MLALPRGGTLTQVKRRRAWRLSFALVAGRSEQRFTQASERSVQGHHVRGHLWKLIHRAERGDDLEGKLGDHPARSASRDRKGGILGVLHLARNVRRAQEILDPIEPCKEQFGAAEICHPPT